MRNIWEKETVHQQGTEDTVSIDTSYKTQTGLCTMTVTEAGADAQPRRGHRPQAPGGRGQRNQRR